MIEVGTHLKGGRWHLDTRLASGGVSIVFAATHRNGSRAAIKVLDSAFTDDEDMRRRFLREGYAANKVGHPGVVRVLDDDVTEEGRAYLVMELLDGEPLDRRRLRLGGKLALAEALQVADELLDVLAAAHAQGIIHRDIKPSNLFLTTKGQLKVLDFGFAKVKEAAQGESTAVGTLLGTPGFLPPERARGESEVDARTDIWSVGATIFTLISGEHVHDADTPLALLVATGRERTRSLESVAPGLPPGVVSTIDRALAFEREERWPNAIEMKEALREASSIDDVTRVRTFVSYVDPEARGDEQTVASEVAAPTASQPKPTSATGRPSDRLRSAKARPMMTEPERVVPRLYDEDEDEDDEDGGAGGGASKGFTKVMALSPGLRAASSGPRQVSLQVPARASTPLARPAVFQFVAPPLAVAPPSKPRRRTLVLLVGAVLALLGIAIGLAAMIPSAP